MHAFDVLNQHRPNKHKAGCPVTVLKLLIYYVFIQIVLKILYILQVYSEFRKYE